jgi:hypothetical protein
VQPDPEASELVATVVVVATMVVVAGGAVVVGAAVVAVEEDGAEGVAVEGADVTGTSVVVAASSSPPQAPATMTMESDTTARPARLVKVVGLIRGP